MNYLCECADVIFYCVMGFILCFFIAAMACIKFKFGNESSWPKPPKR